MYKLARGLGQKAARPASTAANISHDTYQAVNWQVVRLRSRVMVDFAKAIGPSGRGGFTSSGQTQAAISAAIRRQILVNKTLVPSAWKGTAGVATDDGVPAAGQIQRRRWDWWSDEASSYACPQTLVGHRLAADKCGQSCQSCDGQLVNLLATWVVQSQRADCADEANRPNAVFANSTPRRSPVTRAAGFNFCGPGQGCVVLLIAGWRWPPDADDRNHRSSIREGNKALLHRLHWQRSKRLGTKSAAQKAPPVRIKARCMPGSAVRA